MAVSYARVRFYLAGTDVPGLYKIGLTAGSIRERIRAISGAMPFMVYLIRASLPIDLRSLYPAGTARAIEAFIHEKFSGKRIKTEWFMLDHEDIDWTIDFLGDQALQILVARLYLEIRGYGKPDWGGANEELYR
jgi:Meiotically up-regulated gene 113